MIRFGENIVLIRVYVHTEFEYSMMYTKGDIQKKPLRINLGSVKFWNSVLRASIRGHPCGEGIRMQTGISRYYY